MADADTTATADKPKTDEVPDDPGMAEFLRQKNEGSGTKPEPKEEVTTEEEEPAGDETTEGATTEEPAETTTAPEKAEADDDSTAQKDQNRLGFQLRQIRAGDPFVARARKALTDDYVNAEGLTDDQREIRQMKSDRYIEKLETSRATLVSDNQQIAEEYPFFRPLNPDGSKNPEFNEPLYKRAIERFGRDSLEMSEPDENGVQQIVGYKVRLLDYMREEADLYQAASKAGTETKPPVKPETKPAPKDKGKDDAAMDAASEEPGGASTAKTEADEENDPMVKAFLAGFDSA